MINITNFFLLLSTDLFQNIIRLHFVRLINVALLCLKETLVLKKNLHSHLSPATSNNGNS